MALYLFQFCCKTQQNKKGGMPIKDRIPQEIWRDKRIPKEIKYIYSYIHSKGYNRFITDINVGEIKQVVKIKNKG